MLRKMLAGLCLIFIALGLIGAAEPFKASVKAIDYEKRSLTVTVGEDETFPVQKDAKIIKLFFNKDDKKIQEVPGELTDIQAGFFVTLTVETIGNKEVVTTLKVGTKSKKSKKDK